MKRYKSFADYLHDSDEEEFNLAEVETLIKANARQELAEEIERTYENGTN